MERQEHLVQVGLLEMTVLRGQVEMTVLQELQE
jgi:hypothetical protein